MYALLAALLLTGCVEDVGKDKAHAVVEEPAAAPEKKEEAPKAAPVSSKTLAIDASQSSINALSAKVTETHPIDFKDFSGTVTLADDKVTSLSFDVQMATLEADHPKLTSHLKNEDFFDVEKFPTSTFRSSEIKEGGEGGSHTVTGELNIHGMAKKVSFPATISLVDGVVRAKSEFVIDRQDFGISYPGRKDDLIQDNVAMTISFVAK